MQDPSNAVLKSMSNQKNIYAAAAYDEYFKHNIE